MAPDWTAESVGGHVLEVRDARKTYEAQSAPARALRGVDFQMRAGEFVAIMGPSGCGKSTLLNVVAGLERTDEGTVVLDGHDVTSMTEAELARFRRHRVGYVFQFFNLLDGMTVLENVALAVMIGGARRRAGEARGRDLLDLLGLTEKAELLPGSLSGGQRQRLAIARALANRPTLLLADEPTGALDSQGSDEILELLTRLNDSGQAILLVTHNAEVAVGADRTVNMRDGVVYDHNARRSPTAEAGDR